MSRRKKETIANEFIIVPKDMATTPFFTVTPQENRSFITGCRRWDFNMPLTIEHGAVLYNILSFKDPFNPSRDIEFSVCELCKRMFTSDNSENLEKTRKLLLQLETAKVRIVDLDKADVLAALYNAAQPQGKGFMQYSSTPMTPP